MEKGEPRISVCSPAAIGPLARFRIDRVYTDIKISNNIKINHIMVKPEIKPMIENLQDKVYQLDNKQAKGAKLRANIR